MSASNEPRILAGAAVAGAILAIVAIYAAVSEMDYRDEVARETAFSHAAPNVRTGCRMPTIDERLQATAVDSADGVWIQCVYFKADGYGTVGEPVEVELVPQKRSKR